MSLQLRWVGEADFDRVAQTRMLCYSHAGNDLARFQDRVRQDVRSKAGDFLLAERGGAALGTTTSLSMTMWVRGAPVACQGVSWVGTIKTHRRRSEGSDGIATQLMRETIRKGRERGQVISALMPFRGSFYEHFGYGFVERRAQWTLPLAVLPHGPFEGMRFVQPTDLPELQRLRQRVVERGQCDLERPADAWEYLLKQRLEAGFVVVDRPEDDGPIRGYLAFEYVQVGTKDYLRVMQINYQDIAALRRQLHFLSSLRDQYLAAEVTLPADLPLNWLLREPQLPHRLVNHPHAEAKLDTRMQALVLDHAGFIEPMKFPTGARGKAVVSIHPSEGGASRIQLDIAEGRAAVAPTSTSAGFTCADRVWAAIVCGDLPATRAVQLGLASADDARAAEALDIFSVGPAPYCHEYF